MKSRLIKLVNLKSRPYLKALAIQENCVKNIVEAKKLSKSYDNTLILVEHEPVYTIGIRTKEYSDPELRERLEKTGAQFIGTNRGGLITFHGPGQLVAYPVLYLGDFNPQRSVKWYVNTLEKTIISTCDKLGIRNAGTLCEYPGVWIDEQRKIAAIGIHAKHFVTMHGIAINCNCDLKWFTHIVPCGIPDKEVTSISKELGRDMGITDVLPFFLESFQEKFNCTLVS